LGTDPFINKKQKLVTFLSNKHTDMPEKRHDDLGTQVIKYKNATAPWLELSYMIGDHLSKNGAVSQCSKPDGLYGF
jgi:hypothetical protein